MLVLGRDDIQKQSRQGRLRMSQDASPGIAKGLTTLRENSQSAQDWSPVIFSAVPAGLFVALA